MWVVIKVVDHRIIGCAVGPFDTQEAADKYGELAVVGSLGYEKWISKEVLPPSDLGVVATNGPGGSPRLASRKKVRKVEKKVLNHSF